MALSKADLISGLREGLQVKSYLNDATMWLGSMVEFIDKNIHDYGRQILAQFRATSKVGGNEMSLAELVAWCDFHLNKTVPDVVRQESHRAPPYYSLIRHKDTGAVYRWRAGENPIFRHVRDEDYLFFLASCWLSGGWDQVVDAETNLIEFLHQELTDMAVDDSRIEAIIPPPPTTKIYVVVKGDTFGAIAKANGVTIDDLKALNPQITDINNISIGQEIKVPVGPK